MHQLLERQLRNAFGSPEKVPPECRPLLEAVDRSYAAADEDRALLERSLEISSREAFERNKKLAEEAEKLHMKAKELQEARAGMLNVLDDALAAQKESTRSNLLLQNAERIAHIGAWDWDPASGALAWSDEIYELLGLPKEGTKPTYGLFVSSVHPDDRERVKRAVDAALKGKPYDIEHRVVRPDGSVLWLHERAEVARGEDGKPLRMSGTSQDETAQKKAQTKIKELDALKDKFIRIVTHQFRTPLNAIRWNIEALLAEQLGALKPEQKEFLRVTYDANTDVVNRIHDLLTAMDIEEGRAIVTKEAVSVETIWNGVLAEWKKRCALKQLTCEYAPPGVPLPAFEGDGEKIRDAFSKVMDNAVTYTQEKGRVDAKLEYRDGAIRFSVKDTGIGIPEVEQPRMFNRFFRASNAATMKADSSGLGLYISKHFVEQHGGKMGFESEEGKGSTFWFELPATAA